MLRPQAVWVFVAAMGAIYGQSKKNRPECPDWGMIKTKPPSD
jgi:hypothetical protein